jgi:hypothetical protein
VWLCEFFNIYNLGKTYQQLLIPYQILAPVAGSTGDAPFRRETHILFINISQMTRKIILEQVTNQHNKKLSNLAV